MNRSPSSAPFSLDLNDADDPLELGLGSLSDDDWQEDDYEAPTGLDPRQLTTVQMATEKFFATICRRTPQADRLPLIAIGAAQLLVGLLRLSPEHAPEIASAINPQLASANCRLVLL
jgi:hypothetical protein